VRRRPDGGSWHSVAQGVCALLLACIVYGCGFHLRGEADFPFRTLYVNGGVGSPIYTDLVRALRANGRLELVDSPDKAEAILDLSKAPPIDRQILTLSGGGKVSEYLLVQVVGFRVHDGKGGEWVPYGEIRITRNYSFSANLVLATESEEALLRADMQADAVEQVMRRLEAAHKPVPPEQ